MAQHANRRIRYAVVGAGWITQGYVLPAFANASENSTLAAIVSGDDQKLQELGAQYSLDERQSAQLERLPWVDAFGGRMAATWAPVLTSSRCLRLVTEAGTVCVPIFIR